MRFLRDHKSVTKISKGCWETGKEVRPDMKHGEVERKTAVVKELVGLHGGNTSSTLVPRMV